MPPDTLTADFGPAAASTAPDLAELLAWGAANHPFQASLVEQQTVFAAHERLRAQVSDPKACIYGVHTGYGANVDSARDPAAWRRTQCELLGYLQVGVGEPFPDRVVRRALRLQAWKVARGLSGIHPETFRRLIELSHQTQLPVVPSYGSLGASGDLVPMAHAVAPVFVGDGPRGPRDVIGLVNTNSMMSSLALECLDEVRSLWRLGVGVTAAASLALGVADEPFDPAVLARNARQPRITQSGRAILEARGRLLQDLGLRVALRCGPVQERYSIRCAPQIFGNMLENLEFSTIRITAEALSVADNPLVLESGMWHGGLFYAAGLATAADLLGDIVARLGEVVDRQVLLLVGEDTSHGLPENLATAGALHVKGIHQLLSSLNQGLRAAAVPSRSLSFSCEGNNQDVVPCAMVALVHLTRSIELARQALRAGAFCVERALRLRYDVIIPDDLTLTAWSSYEPSRISRSVA